VKGLETIIRGAALAGGVRIQAHGSDTSFEGYKLELERLVRELGSDVELGGPVSRAEVPALLAGSHVLVNNTRAGGLDKVVYEAAASCLPVLASNAVFGDLLPDELRFEPDDPAGLAERFRRFDRQRRPELRELVARNHSVEHWADGVLATVELG
jgi:glycosyltransferase involved in cell wall biosynthesis